MTHFGRMAFLVLCVCARVSGDDSLVALLRSADAEHCAECLSGSMSILLRNDYPESGDFTELKGDVEWDEDYLYFDGFYADQLQQIAGSTKPAATTDCKYRFVRSGDDAIGWVQRLGDWKGRFSSENWVVLFPFTRLRDSKVMRLTPNPVTILTTYEGLAETEFPRNLLNESAVNTKGVPFERELLRDGSHVAVHSRYTHGMECTATFDLGSGGLCIDRKVVHLYKKPNKIVTSTRQYQQNALGKWFPAASTLESRVGSSSPDRTARVEISKFEPLGQRRFTGVVTQDALGKLPSGTEILEIDDDGKPSHRVVDPPDLDNFEDRLLQLTDKIRGTGFGGKQE